MGLFPRAYNAKRILQRVLSGTHTTDIPRGHLAVYVGESYKKRFVVPISFLKSSSFKDLLAHAEEEFGYEHPMGGLTIPCKVEEFIDLTRSLSVLLEN